MKRLPDRFRLQWLLALDTVISLRPLFLVVSIMFLFAVCMGLLFPELLSTFVSGVIETLIEETQTLSWSALVFFILGTNLKAAMTSILLGVVFGIVPTLSAAMNGYLLGAVLIQKAAETTPLIAFQLLPHGVFELPAILLSYALGLSIGLLFFKRPVLADFMAAYRDAGRVLVLVILPLLIIAAVIEATLFGAL